MRATDQWNREIPVVAQRGVICDRNGDVLVSNDTTYRLFVRPSSVDNKAELSHALADVLTLSQDEIYKKITTSKVSEVTIAKGCTKKQIEQVIRLNYDGVYYSRDNKRVYSYDEALCQVLGFTSSDGDGLSGLEKYYDIILKGQNGEIMYTTDIVGRQTDDCKIIYNNAREGDRINLTIDIDIQLACESAIKNAYIKHNAKSVSCLILNPMNCEVIALANYPSYNLNEIPRDDIETLNKLSRNSLVCDIYEPGSTFKIVTTAINVEEYNRGNERAFSPSRVFNSSRTRSIDGTTIKCWSDHKNGKHSNQTLEQALNTSCNPCFTDIALALGKDTFYEYLGAFGFGKSTGIDFGGEANGLLLPKSLVKNCDLARVGFGQTVAVTGLQLACATACIVNGGNYYSPRLIKSVYSSKDGSVYEYESNVKTQPISRKTSQEICSMLESVVKNGGGKNATVEGYRVAGKTGTAQKYQNGAIASGKYVSSFIGFFPANSPKYLALVIVDEPQGAYYGSVVAAPLAKEIFTNIIQIRDIKIQGD